MKLLVKLFLLLLLFICNPAFAENFYIENYVVNINVTKDKVAQVTEDIYTNFTNSSHGIVREIPTPKASITNISVSENFNVRKNKKRTFIRIGNADKYVKGPVHYTIKYFYRYRDNKNEFYNNLLKVPAK